MNNIINLSQSIFDLVESFPLDQQAYTLEQISDALVTTIYEDTTSWSGPPTYKWKISIPPEINILMRKSNKDELRDVFYLVYGRETSLEDYIPCLVHLPSYQYGLDLLYLLSSIHHAF